MADTAEIKGLKFNVEGETKKAEESLDSLASSLQKIKSVTKDGLGLNKIVKEMQDFQKNIPNMANMSGGLNSYISELQKKYDKIKSIIGGGSEIKESQKGTQTSSDVTGIPTDSTEKVSRFRSALSGLFASGSQVSSVFKKTGASVFGFLKNLALSPIKRFGNAIQGLIGKVQHLISALGRIALYRFMRSLIKGITSALKEGTNNLYEYSKTMGTDFHNSMDQIATDALYLKNSFAAAVAPIINALAPAIDALANKIAYLLNLLAQLFSAFGGKGTYTKAVKGATQFGDATGSAAEAVKYLISGFDELNVMTKNSGGGGGGGGAAGMFEEVPIDSAITDFVNRFKEAIAAGDWYGAGEVIGEAINTAVNAAYDWLKSKDFGKWGRNFANLLNGIIESTDFTMIGKTIGLALRDAIKFGFNFVTTFNWKNLGKKIGDFVNGIIEELNAIDPETGLTGWEELGLGLARFLNGILDLLMEIIKTIDWWSVAKGIMKAITSFFSEANPIIDIIIGGILIKKIGSLILSKAAQEAVATKLGTAVTTVAQAGIAVGAGVLLGFAISDIIEPGSTETFFDAFNDTYNADSFGGNLKIWAEEWGRILKEDWNALFTPDPNGSNYQRGLYVVIEFFKDIGEVVAEKFRNFTAETGEFFTGLWLDVSGFFSTVATDIGNWFSQAWTDVSTWFTNAVSNVGGFFEGLWTDISSWFETCATDIGSWFETAWSDITSWFETAISDIGGWFEGIWSDLSSWFETTASNVGSWFSTAWQNVSGWFSNAIQSVGGWFSNIWGSVSGFFTTVVTNAGQFFSGLWTTISTWFSNTWSTVSGWFGSLPEKIKGFFADAGQWLLDAGRRIVEGIWNGISGAWEWLKEKVGGAVSSLVGGVKDLLGIASPSKVFASIGQFITEGLGEGITSKTSTLMAQADSVVSELTDRMTPSLNGMITGTPSSVYMDSTSDGTDASILNVLMQMFEFMQSNNGNNNDRDMKVIIDGKEVFNVVVNENNRAIRRSGGVSPLRV